MNYEILMLLWEESLEIVKETEMRSRISGIAACMQSFDFFFGVVLSELILIILVKLSSHQSFQLLKDKVLLK